MAAAAPWKWKTSAWPSCWPNRRVRWVSSPRRKRLKSMAAAAVAASRPDAGACVPDCRDTGKAVLKRLRLMLLSSPAFCVPLALAQDGSDTGNGDAVQEHTEFVGPPALIPAGDPTS